MLLPLVTELAVVDPGVADALEVPEFKLVVPPFPVIGVTEDNSVAGVLVWLIAEVTVVTIPPGRVTGPTDTLTQATPTHEETPAEVVMDPLLDVVGVIPRLALRLRQRAPTHEADCEVTVASVVGVVFESKALEEVGWLDEGERVKV